MSIFTIDFFELAFLAEACIPPRPIARAMFWQSLTDKYWEQMSEGERAHLFEWLQKSWVYEESLKEEEDTQVFHSRFNPDNQYSIKVNYNGEISEHRAFKLNDNYYIGRNKWVADKYIVSIEKFTPKREY
jgi:hypothetical protein